jgi:hypothetical protein
MSPAAIMVKEHANVLRRCDVFSHESDNLAKRGAARSIVSLPFCLLMSLAAGSVPIQVEKSRKKK